MDALLELKIVGVCVLGRRLSVCYNSRRLAYVPNTPGGIAWLLEYIQARSPSLIVIEPDGGLERPLVQALTDARIPLAVADPDHVERFARETGRLAHTVALIDARMLCAYGAKMRGRGAAASVASM